MKIKKGLGVFVSGTVAALAIAGLVAAFVTNASPYVTIAQAKEASGDRLHVAGEIVPGSVARDVERGVLRFSLRDADGQTAHVEYRGSAVSNLSEAKQVVVVGAMRGGAFQADKMLVKCPSRYEGEKKA